MTAAASVRPRAIVLDDDPAVRAILSEAVSTAGLTVSAADCAEAAFAAMASLPTPSVLITDIDLGDGPDGIAVAEHARALWPDMPIFVVSGRPSPDTSFEARLSIQFFPKPVRMATLLTALAAVVVAANP